MPGPGSRHWTNLVVFSEIKASYPIYTDRLSPGLSV